MHFLARQGDAKNSDTVPLIILGERGRTRKMTQQEIGEEDKLCIHDLHPLSSNGTCNSFLV